MLRKKSVRNSSNQRIQNQKVLITVGSNETGKSSLLTQLTKQKFSPQYKSTIGVDYYSKEFKDKNNKKLILSIWDTNGAEKETPILPSKIYYSADAFLILCSYDNKKSFESLVDWINFLRNQREKHQSTEFNNKLITTFVIINKSDLQQKLFSQQDVKDLIHKIFPTVFICETSANNEKRVNKLFNKILYLLFKNETKNTCSFCFNDDEIVKVEKEVTTKNGYTKLMETNDDYYDLCNSSIQIEKVMRKRCGDCC